MTSAISSLSSSFYNNVVAANPRQNASKVDSDGDHDNSRPGEVEKAKPMSGTLGTMMAIYAQRAKKVKTGFQRRACSDSRMSCRSNSASLP